MIHSTPFFTNRNAIFTDGKIILIFGFDSPFFIQVNKGSNSFAFTVFINRHGIMGRIKKQPGNLKFRQKAFHSKKSMQESMGIMS